MATPPRSLADDLRQRDDAALAALLRSRPDLAHPLPADLGQLAARSVTQAATARAVDRLNRFNLHVLEAVVVLPEPVATTAVASLLDGVEPATVQSSLRELAGQALLWGQDDAWRATATVKEVLGRHPAGLGPPTTELPGVQPVGDVDRVLSEAPDDVREVLERLTWGPPSGRIDNADRPLTIDTARTPIEWLLARGILVATDKNTVVLPREIGLHLRGGRLHRTVTSEPPSPVLVGRDTAAVDRAAAGTAFDLVRRIEDLLETWAVDPPSVLRSGGVGVREVRAAAARLDIDEPNASLLIEIAHAAGLLATSGDADDVWLPTPAYDVWRTHTTAYKWTELLHAWLETTRVPGLIGTRDGKDARINVLANDLDRVVAPDIRLAVLADLAHQPPGTGMELDSLIERQEWRRPRRGGRLRDDFVRWTLEEASALGGCALGALSTPARLLLDDDIDAAVAALDKYLPAPIDHVLLQADLTAIAPGPLESDVSRELALLADVESSGGATVYRFSESSIRRALDAGRSAIDVRTYLERHSSTPVPQPLTYLIEDVARRHGRIRVGSASAYVRSDDPAVLDELMADRRSDALRLRRLAATVIAAQASPDVVLDRLRQIGLVPAAESSDGSVLVRRPDSRRTGARQRPPRLLADPPAPSTAVAGAAVRAMRSGERAGERDERVVGPAATTALPKTAVTETIEILRRAAEAKQSVWLGYVGTDGVAAERVVDPVEVRGGWLTAFDHRVEQVRTFAVHRVTGVAVLDPTLSER
jgi:hypothetical protein